MYTFAAVAVLNGAWTLRTETSTDDASFWFGLEAGLVLALLAQFVPNPRVRAFGRGVAYCAFGILIVGSVGAALLWSMVGAGGS